MSTSTETTAPPQKKGDFWVWAGVVFGVVEINLVRWLTDWPWWAYSAPAIGVGVIAVAYHRAKNRRREAAAESAQDGR